LRGLKEKKARARTLSLPVLLQLEEGLLAISGQEAQLLHFLLGLLRRGALALLLLLLLLPEDKMARSAPGSTQRKHYSAASPIEACVHDVLVLLQEWSLVQDLEDTHLLLEALLLDLLHLLQPHKPSGTFRREEMNEP
jgi:hypothetical protein